jgi:hypothetical protein
MNMVLQPRFGFFVLVTAITSPIFAPHFAQGDTIYTGTNFNIQVSTPVDVGTTPLKAITLTAIGKNGALPSAFGGTGISTIGNALHQIYEGNFVPTPTTTLIVPGSIPENLDTHFLVDTNNIIAITAPNENRNTLSAVENAFGGFGNVLNGVFTLKGTPTSSTWDMAYLVVPDGAQLNFNFSVSADGYSPELVNTSYTVPEPSAIALLAAGCIGLLFPIRRRRK